ncbi:hypothetical protein BKA82DRAFT_4341663 [Pisolithus tinctorius]|nr:hypothetical protein BKA82DRAFT_4341663 [Pisolithus tinctorius]
MATKNLGKESIVISGKLQISRPTGGHAQEAWRRVGTEGGSREHSLPSRRAGKRSQGNGRLSDAASAFVKLKESELLSERRFPNRSKARKRWNVGKRSVTGRPRPTDTSTLCKSILDCEGCPGVESGRHRKGSYSACVSTVQAIQLLDQGDRRHTVSVPRDWGRWLWDLQGSTQRPWPAGAMAVLAMKNGRREGHKSNHISVLAAASTEAAAQI